MNDKTPVDADVTENIQDAEALVAPLLEILGATLPLNTASVVQAVRYTGRAVDHQRIKRLLAIEAVPMPKCVGGNLWWQAQDIVNVMTACDVRRYWLVDSRIWETCATEAMRATESIRRDKSAFNNALSRLENHTIGELALMISVGETEESRDRTLSLLLMKLEALGIE